jgi:hypothetical protein
MPQYIVVSDPVYKGPAQRPLVPGRDYPRTQSYLEEFTFRFNRRASRSRGLVFRRLIEQAVVTGPVTEAKLIHGYHW